MRDQGLAKRPQGWTGDELEKAAKAETAAICRACNDPDKACPGCYFDIGPTDYEAESAHKADAQERDTLVDPCRHCHADCQECQYSK